MAKLNALTIAFIFVAGLPAAAASARTPTPPVEPARPTISADYEAVAKVAAMEAREKELATQRDIADLNAQQSMARSAGNLLAPSWAQVWIAGIGLIGLTLSLTFTAWSLRQTREALKSQRDTADLDMRAYVGSDDLTKKNFAVGQKPVFSFVVKNFGKTPAYDVQNSISLKIVPKGGEPNFQVAPLEQGMTINPGGGFVLSEKLPALTKEQFDRFTGDELQDGDSISLVLQIKYKTLGQTRTLKVSMILWGAGASHSKIVTEESFCD